MANIMVDAQMTVGIYVLIKTLKLIILSRMWLMQLIILVLMVSHYYVIVT